jgi:hypothetical protein
LVVRTSGGAGVGVGGGGEHDLAPGEIIVADCLNCKRAHSHDTHDIAGIYFVCQWNWCELCISMLCSYVLIVACVEQLYPDADSLAKDSVQRFVAYY